MDLAIIDEVPGTIMPLGSVSFSSPTITVRALIRSRVELEIERLRDQVSSLGPAVPSGAIEERLNGAHKGFGLRRYFLRSEDAGSADTLLERHCEEAEEGFERGRYFLLLDDRQADSLDEEIDLGRTAEATFLLLTPLRGG